MENLHKPALSIVTVTYNDPPGLVRTLESLRSLFATAGGRIEILVQDGLSSEPFGQIRAAYGEWVNFESEADNGIYDAMNRGLARTKGSYIWFLNGGDKSTISDWSEMEELLALQPSSMVLGAYWLDLGSRQVLRRPRAAQCMWHALPTSHQAILYPGDQARLLGYDTDFKVAGDYAFTARLSQLCGTVLTVRPLAVFGVGGTSSIHAKLIAKEAERVQAEILGSGHLARLASRTLHTFSRVRRRLASKPMD